MDHELLRLECLKLAQGENLTGAAAIARAQEIFDFLRVGADSATETRRIVAGMSNAHVTVEAVGNQVLDRIKNHPFKDYKPE